MKLRRWQSEAVSQCVSHFHSGQPHFLCLATPGAGKTVMASTVAKQLIESGDIDLVLCFSPSVSVSESFRAILESIIDARLDGRLGAKGLVLTYQSMINLDASFWSLLRTHRTLVIFDEIHHCAGDHQGNANAWGEKIIQYIQGRVTYSLALTGTPWRSDRIPIALTSYCHEGKVRCDYTYGLSQAIGDGVCRTPRIIAVDNQRITVTHDGTEEIYRSFAELLAASRCTYQQLLENPELLQYLLEFSHRTLLRFRCTNPSAAGLIVAASVEHALLIAETIDRISGEYPAVVTYRHDDPQAVIRRFRDANTPWIVSVGMISEGTDIPRLQVCCHLTRVKTELYFRQVLGRILRVRHGAQEDAVLIMPAEPTLMGFAHRVAEDIPSANAVSIKTMEEGLAPPAEQHVSVAAASEESKPSMPKTIETVVTDGLPLPDLSLMEMNTSTPRPLTSLAETYESTLGLFGRFQRRMIEFSPRMG